MTTLARFTFGYGDKAGDWIVVKCGPNRIYEGELLVGDDGRVRLQSEYYWNGKKLTYTERIPIDEITSIERKAKTPLSEPATADAPTLEMDPVKMQSGATRAPRISQAEVDAMSPIERIHKQEELFAQARTWAEHWGIQVEPNPKVLHQGEENEEWVLVIKPIRPKGPGDKVHHLNEEAAERNSKLGVETWYAPWLNARMPADVAMYEPVLRVFLVAEKDIKSGSTQKPIRNVRHEIEHVHLLDKGTGDEATLFAGEIRSSGKTPLPGMAADDVYVSGIDLSELPVYGGDMMYLSARVRTAAQKYEAAVLSGANVAGQLRGAFEYEVDNLLLQISIPQKISGVVTAAFDALPETLAGNQIRTEVKTKTAVVRGKVVQAEVVVVTAAWGGVEVPIELAGEPYLSLHHQGDAGKAALAKAAHDRYQAIHQESKLLQGDLVKLETWAKNMKEQFAKLPDRVELGYRQGAGVQTRAYKEAHSLSEEVGLLAGSARIVPGTDPIHHRLATRETREGHFTRIDYQLEQLRSSVRRVASDASSTVRVEFAGVDTEYAAFKQHCEAWIADGSIEARARALSQRVRNLEQLVREATRAAKPLPEGVSALVADADHLVEDARTMRQRQNGQSRLPIEREKPELSTPAGKAHPEPNAPAPAVERNEKFSDKPERTKKKISGSDKATVGNKIANIRSSMVEVHYSGFTVLGWMVGEISDTRTNGFLIVHYVGEARGGKDVFDPSRAGTVITFDVLDAQITKVNSPTEVRDRQLYQAMYRHPQMLAELRTQYEGKTIQYRRYEGYVGKSKTSLLSQITIHSIDEQGNIAGWGGNITGRNNAARVIKAENIDWSTVTETPLKGPANPNPPTKGGSFDGPDGLKPVFMEEVPKPAVSPTSSGLALPHYSTDTHTQAAKDRLFGTIIEPQVGTRIRLLGVEGNVIIEGTFQGFEPRGTKANDVRVVVRNDAGGFFHAHANQVGVILPAGTPGSTPLLDHHPGEGYPFILRYFDSPVEFGSDGGNTPYLKGAEGGMNEKLRSSGSSLRVKYIKGDGLYNELQLMNAVEKKIFLYGLEHDLGFHFSSWAILTNPMLDRIGVNAGLLRSTYDITRKLGEQHADLFKNSATVGHDVYRGFDGQSGQPLPKEGGAPGENKTAVFRDYAYALDSGINRDLARKLTRNDVPSPGAVEALLRPVLDPLAVEPVLARVIENLPEFVSPEARDQFIQLLSAQIREAWQQVNMAPLKETELTAMIAQARARARGITEAQLQRTIPRDKPNPP